MIRSPGRREAAVSDFALCAGLLSAVAVDGHTLEEVATRYGFTVPRLRAKLENHIAACTTALMIEPPIPTPEAAPMLPPEPAVRIRQRVPRAA